MVTFNLIRVVYSSKSLWMRTDVLYYSQLFRFFCHGTVTVSKICFAKDDAYLISRRHMVLTTNPVSYRIPVGFMAMYFFFLLDGST